MRRAPPGSGDPISRLRTRCRGLPFKDEQRLCQALLLGQITGRPWICLMPVRHYAPIFCRHVVCVCQSGSALSA
jgi:hypothetical protein